MSKFKLSHVVWDCKYYIVLVPKYRYKVFNREIQIFVKEELKKLCTWMRIEIIEGHVCKDHIHMCVAIPLEIAISDAIGTLKGKTAIRFFNKFTELKRRYWGSHFWCRGYSVNTVGRNPYMST